MQNAHFDIFFKIEILVLPNSPNYSAQDSVHHFVQNEHYCQVNCKQKVPFQTKRTSLQHSVSFKTHIIDQPIAGFHQHDVITTLANCKCLFWRARQTRKFSFLLKQICLLYNI